MRNRYARSASIDWASLSASSALATGRSTTTSWRPSLVPLSVSAASGPLVLSISATPGVFWRVAVWVMGFLVVGSQPRTVTDCTWSPAASVGLNSSRLGAMSVLRRPPQASVYVVIGSDAATVGRADEVQHVLAGLGVGAHEQLERVQLGALLEECRVVGVALHDQVVGGSLLGHLEPQLVALGDLLGDLRSR